MVLGPVRHQAEVTFDDSGWSADELDYVLVGACYSSPYWTEYLRLAPGGPIILRLEATDAMQTVVRAEVRLQPSCALANGSTTPPPAETMAELCLQQCPDF